MSHLRLVAPAPEHRDGFLALVAEARAAGEDAYLWDYHDDYLRYLRETSALSRGEDLAPGMVPCDVLFLVDRDDRGAPRAGPLPVLGFARVRHRLNERLEEYGGHIGYYVTKSVRGRGLGTAILRLALARTAELGLASVLVTCDADNLGSVRVLEKNGAVRESEGRSPKDGAKLLRWSVRIGPPAMST